MNYQLATDFNYNKTNFYVCHYPWLSWRPGTVMLHGHVHGNALTLPADSRQQWRYDVGVDVVWNHERYYPVSIHQIEEAIAQGIYPTKERS
jgi:calcineurin-like phosphoesterase family protein